MGAGVCIVVANKVRISDTKNGAYANDERERYGKYCDCVFVQCAAIERNVICVDVFQCV